MKKDRPRSLDEEIARHLEEAARSGELAGAKGYGKPLPGIEGWDDTPPPLRMPFKILKDAGVVPAEVAWMRERAELRRRLEEAADEAERARLRKALAELEQKIALRLEALRINSTL
jgi:hypothetical protein